MRITTRLGVGLAAVAALTVGATVYQLGVISQLRDLNEELALSHVEAARISLRVVENVEGMGFFAGSYLMRGAVEDRERWVEYEEAVEADLTRLADLELSTEEEEQRAELFSAWEHYRGTASRGPETTTLGLRPPSFLPLAVREGGDGPDPQAALQRVETALDEVRGATELLLARNEEAAGATARASREAAERARTISLLGGVGVVMAAVLVFVLVFISVSGPLRRLAHGTRELARGRLEHRLNVKGRHELAELASDFNHMAERLHELDHLKRDFVSHVSHELKGPLASIQETIDVMLEEIPGPISRKQRDLLSLSRDSSNRLASMIRNLLEASRLEAGMEDYALEPHDLRNLVDSVHQELAGMANDRNQVVEVEVRSEDTRFVGDGARIREVVSNLLGNAVKFSSRSGQIRVRIHTPGETGEDMAWGEGTTKPVQGLETVGSVASDPVILLDVEDDGPGVPDEDKSRIFDKFYRARQDRGEARSGAEAGGVGLGLAISRRITEAHGGELWVEDAPSGGACFRLLLPRRPQVPVDGSGWRRREGRSEEPHEPEDGGGDPDTRPTEATTGASATENSGRSGSRRSNHRATLERW